MCSYEDRIRAVKLHIKFGKRTGPTIWQLGYPTKSSLKGWYREHQQVRDLRAGYARARQMYSAQRIQTAVQHYLDHDRRIASTIKTLGYVLQHRQVVASRGALYGRAEIPGARGREQTRRV